MNCEIPLLDPREPIIRRGDIVTITDVTHEHIAVEVVDCNGITAIKLIPRKQIGSA